MSKQYAHLHAMAKTSVKFQNDWPKTVGGVALTSQLLTNGRTDKRTNVRTDKRTNERVTARLYRTCVLTQVRQKRSISEHIQSVNLLKVKYLKMHSFLKEINNNKNGPTRLVQPEECSDSFAWNCIENYWNKFNLITNKIGNIRCYHPTNSCHTWAWSHPSIPHDSRKQFRWILIHHRKPSGSSDLSKHGESPCQPL